MISVLLTRSPLIPTASASNSSTASTNAEIGTLMPRLRTS